MLSLREVIAFYSQKADFWLPNFGFKSSLLSLLKQKNMTNVAVFMVNISRAQTVFKIPLVCGVAFAITFEGINTLRG